MNEQGQCCEQIEDLREKIFQVVAWHRSRAIVKGQASISFDIKENQRHQRAQIAFVLIVFHLSRSLLFPSLSASRLDLHVEGSQLFCLSQSMPHVLVDSKTVSKYTYTFKFKAISSSIKASIYLSPSLNQPNRLLRSSST